MASLDFDQKFLGRIAKQTSDSNPFLSDALYQILGLSVLLARRLIRARKLRKLDTTRDTPSLSAYQHILWMSREGLSILELHVIPYAQDDQYGPECRVLSIKLRASFYHIFCLFHNQPPVTTANLATTDPRLPGAPPLPTSPRRKNNPPGLSLPLKRTDKQPALREPINSIVSESSFVTNPYAGAGGPVATPPHAPPGLNPIPIPQPSSFILPPLNFVPLASGYFTTATSYATSYLPGSHPLRLSVALEHSAFLWDCLHDHDASRRVARCAIKDVYRAQEAMDDTEFEDAAELVGILGRMMKRKSRESTPRVGGMASPEPQNPPQAMGGVGEQTLQSTSATQHQSPPRSRRAAEFAPIPDSSRQWQTQSTSHGRTSSAVSAPPGNENPRQGNTPRTETQRHVRTGSQGTPPQARHTSLASDASSTPKAPLPGSRSPTTPSTVRTAYQPAGSSPSQTATPQLSSATPFSLSAAASLVSDQPKYSLSLRRSPPARLPPSQGTLHA